MKWMSSNRSQLPTEYLPGPLQEVAFCRLLYSILQTSFRVERLVFNEESLKARLEAGNRKSAGDWRRVRQVLALAVKHLAASEGMKITEADAREFALERVFQEDTRIWAYVWALNQRAKGKSKGATVYLIGRSLPPERRNALDVDCAWASRASLVSALKQRFG